MPRSVSTRLYACLAAATLLVLLSVAFTLHQVATLARLQIQGGDALALRKADLMAFSQAWALAAYRDFLRAPSGGGAEAFRTALERERAYRDALRVLLKDDVQSLEKLAAFAAAFDAWAVPARAWLDGSLRRRGAPPEVFYTIQGHLLPAFEGLAAREREKAQRRQEEVRALRAATLRFLALGWLASLGAGGWLVLATLRGARRDLAAATATTSSAATQITATLAQQERSLAEQAAAINEVAATTAELNATTAQAAQNGEIIGRRSAEASSSARQVGETARQGLEDMAGLKATVDGIARQILDLSEQTGQIGAILASVSDIAGQTNLLALNAAVEAARAGEQGRGFGVVAAEIRKLADQSRQALERITPLLLQIQKVADAMVQTAGESGRRAESTIRQAGATGQAIQALLAALEETALNTQQIALNLKQQTLGVGQINEAMAGVNHGIKETVAGILQVKAGLQNLLEMGRGLQTIV